MSTLLSVLSGIGSVTVLFLGMLIYKAFGAVSSTKTSGLGALLGDLSWIITNPGFWLSAVLLFLGTVFLSWRRYGLAHS